MNDRRPGPPDPYGILGVDASASDDEVHAAYRRRAQDLHPDLHPDDPDAHDAMRALNEAWAVVGDPVRRARYDHAVTYGIDADEGSSDGSSPYDTHGEDDGIWLTPRRGVPFTAILLLVLFAIFVVTAYAGPH